MKTNEPNYGLVTFRKAGIKPFENFDFSVYDVYQLHEYVLKYGTESLEQFEHFKEMPHYFDLWFVRTKVDMKNEILEKVEQLDDEKSNLQIKAYLHDMLSLLPRGNGPIQYTFLIVKKDVSDVLRQCFESMDYQVGLMHPKELTNIQVM